MRAVAVDLDGVLGDTKPLWRDWLTDLARRARLDGAVPEDVAEARLDDLEGNWRTLLERFAEEHAPVYFRPSSEATAALRRLQAAGIRIGAFTDAPEPLARVAAAHLGAGRRLEALEAGSGSLERLLARLGEDTQVVRTSEELSALST
jgi:phosphoglycolate phosphatase-like HAD superfamily hydrolase